MGTARKTDGQEVGGGAGGAGQGMKWGQGALGWEDCLRVHETIVVCQTVGVPTGGEREGS